MIRRFFILITALVVLLLSGCKGEESGEPMTAVASITTYEGTTSEGISTFSYTDNKHELITLSARWNGNEGLKAGRRVLITYKAEQYGVSSDIILYSVSPIPGGEPKYEEKAAIPTQSEPQRQVSAWISGSYLNLSSIVTFGGVAKSVSLYVDKNTQDLQVPIAYIIIESDHSSLAAERALYASWDISALLAEPRFEMLKLIYVGTNNQQTELLINN